MYSATSLPKNKTHFLSLGTFLTKYISQVKKKHISYLHGVRDYCFHFKTHVFRLIFTALFQGNDKGLNYISKVHMAANPKTKKKGFSF